MRKIYIKSIVLISLILIIINLNCNIAYATDLKEVQMMNEYFDSTEDYEAGLIQTWLGSILVIVQVLGVGIGMISFVISLIQYLINYNTENREKYKKRLIFFLVLAIILFLASGILGIIRTGCSQANNLISE